MYVNNSNMLCEQFGLMQIIAHEEALTILARSVDPRDPSSMLEAVQLLKPRRVIVGHDHSGSGWFLDKVVVRQADNPDYDTTFECNRCVTSLPADFCC